MDREDTVKVAENLHPLHSPFLASVVAPVLARVPRETGELLSRELSPTGAAATPEAFPAAWASMARRTGKSPVMLTDDERGRLTAASVTAPRTEAETTQGTAPLDLSQVVHGSGLDEVARMALLFAAIEYMPSSDGGEFERVVQDCFHRGDNRERQAVLKALAWLPHPSTWLPLAVEACRTNVLTVFEAIACDNPFPARRFPDESFFQMALKCLFIGARVGRVIGLEDRKTSELVRMAEAYASERRAAGRPLPDDLTFLLGPPNRPPREPSTVRGPA